MEGILGDAPGMNFGVGQGAGETVMFWVDLSSAAAGNLIEGNFNTASPTVKASADISGSQLALYLPQARIGRNHFVYAYSGAYASGSWSSLGVNYFGLSAVDTIAAVGYWGELYSRKRLLVAEAFAIDKKIDDGLPQSGGTMAWFLNGNQFWADGTDATMAANQPAPYTGALPPSAATCYDNGGVNGAMTTYSLGQNSGVGANCALSFKFQ